MMKGISDQTDRRTRDLRQGLAWLRQGRADLALALLQELQEAHPDDPQIKMSVATAQLRSGETVKALDAFSSLFRSHPDHTGALQGRGLCLHRLGDRSEALDAFRQVVSLDLLAWRAWQSIADITPYEDERIHALEGAADALMVLCSAETDATDLLPEAARALLDARRPVAAVRILQAYKQTMEAPKTGKQRFAQALYHKGDFEAAFLEARRAFARFGVEAVTPRPAFRPDAAAQGLLKLTAILETAGIRPFLAAGTLLGFCRDGGPLPHDRDVDIGVLRDTSGGRDLAGCLRAHPDILMPRRARPGDRYFQVSLDGIAIDLFLYDEKDGALVCGLGNIPGDIQWRFTAFGLDERTFGGRRWWVPAAPERYLTESYGPGWQRPDRHFASVLSSPALWGVNDCVRGCYAIWRAEYALRAGDRHKAAALLRQSPLTADLAGDGDTEAPPGASDTDPSGKNPPAPD